MKTGIKILISAVVGFAIAWVCYQVFHLEQIMTTVVSVSMTSAAWAVCDKLLPRKQ
jgi:hypothetical protein